MLDPNIEGLLDTSFHREAKHDIYLNVFVTACVDEMLTAGPNVLSPSSDDIPVGNIPNIFTPVGASTVTSNPSPTVEFTLNSDQPPQVTTVRATVLNAEKVEVTLEQPNGDKTTKVFISFLEYV